MNSNHHSIGVVFITHKAKNHLPNCIQPIINSSVKPRVLVVNSSSNDGTVELAQSLGAETLVIPRVEFNHGATRELARKYLKTDIVIMMTPDAYAKESNMIEKLIEPIIKGHASIAYARQVPHKKANFFESFAREFNYPIKSHIRSKDDLSKYGVYTFFCSNACAAYLNSALDEIGGFDTVLLGEDTIAVAKLLNKNHKIAYVAEAVVHHSHSYSLKDEFKRNFDTGYARKCYEKIIVSGQSDLSRGKKYVLDLLKTTLRRKPILFPYAIIQSFVKLVGYKLGSYSITKPLWFKKACSSQDFYWESNFFK